MSRKGKESHGLQVFPFLAVLVCTMGALIFLLLVTTTQIRKRPVETPTSEVGNEEFASNDLAPLKPPNSGFSDSDENSNSTVIVIPPQPPQETPREVKPIKVPDQSYALALAQREREIDELTTKWKVRTNILAKERKRYEAALKEHKALFNAAVERADQLKADLAKFESQLVDINRDLETTAADTKDEAERRLVEKKIAELKKQLLAAQAQDASPDNAKYQVIPFDVQTGTTRRPIFIECTESGIRFQPENILITAQDLDGFPTHINPLAAGTGALINYWTELNRKQRSGKSDLEPYILLMVRPDGVIAYYAALDMLKPIRTSHGYELIDDSIKVQYPEADPGARIACQRAIERVLAERETITKLAIATGGSGSVFRGSARSAAQGGGKGGSDGERRGGSGGGGGGNGGSLNRSGDSTASNGNFSMSDVEGESTAVGTRSWERMENFLGQRPQRRSSSGQGNGMNGIAAGYRTGGGNASGGSGPSSTFDGRGQGGPTPSGSAPGGAAPSGSKSGAPAGTRVAGGGPVGNEPSSGRSPGSKSMFGDDDDNAETIGPKSEQTSRDGQHGSVADAGQEVGNFGLSGAVPDSLPDGVPSGSPSGRPPQRGTRSGSSSAGPSGSNLYGGPPGTEPGAGEGSGGGGSGSSGGRSTGSVNGTGNGTAFGSRNTEPLWNGATADPNMPIGERPRKKRKSTASQTMSDDAGDDSGDDGGGSTGSPNGSGPGRRGNRSMISDTASGARRDPNGNRPSADSGQSRAKPSHDQTDRLLEPEMLAGRRWGFCEPGATIGLEREVRIDVSPERFVVAELYEVPAGEDISKQETFERFATTLDRHSREWGRPPQGFFWTPRLKFVVKPEAYGQYEQMNSLMVRAGLSTGHELAKSNETIQYGREQTSSTKLPPRATAKPTAGGNR